MSSRLTLKYELLDSEFKPLNRAVLRFELTDLVDDLRRGVLQDNINTFLSGYDHGFLDVYPADTATQVMEDRNQALDPLQILRDLSHLLDRKLIVIARALPARLSVETESALQKFLRLLQPLLDIEPRVIELIKKRTKLLFRVKEACQNEQDALNIYHDAELMFGTSTKNSIIAGHTLRDLKINGEFEIPQESSSFFYKAWDAGVPCILKFPERGSTAELEYKVYQKITNSRKEYLVEIELIEFSNLPDRHSHQNYALRMPIYTSTLQSCPQGPELSTLFENVAVAVFEALCAMHDAGYCHLDVKPGNIFIDSRGGAFLGDYDAALHPGQTVTRTTPTYLPKELAILNRYKMLTAAPAIDFGMLACTLMYMLNAKYSSTSISELESWTIDLNTNRHPKVHDIMLKCLKHLREDGQARLGAEMQPSTLERNVAAYDDQDTTHSGLQPLV